MNGVLQHRWRAVWFLVLSASAAGAGGGIAPGRFPGSATAGAALDRCSQADHARGPARADLLKKGLALAEEAVAADDGDARAHFAVFCNLGKQAHDAGLSIFNLGKLPRLRREVDRTLELAPDSADALVGKGAMLREMPRRARSCARRPPGRRGGPGRGETRARDGPRASGRHRGGAAAALLAELGR